MDILKATVFLAMLGSLTAQTDCETGGAEDDVDGDGWTVELGDCDDEDASVYPGAEEDTCNGVDDDCDGAADSDITYVDADADPAVADGTSWATAWSGFDALSEADSCIWVAEGTYRTTQINGTFFIMSDEQQLYGGFDGSESTRAARAELFTSTILDADVNLSGGRDAGDNHHLLKLADEVTVDGFTLQGGYADGGDPGGYGGAIYGDGNNDVVLRNLIVQDNEAVVHGGALSVDNCTITIERCKFNRNYAADNGGAIAGWWGTELTIIDSQFNSNESYYNGGAIFMALGRGDLTILNTAFYDNTTRDSGGAISFGNYSDLRIDNSSFYLNDAAYNAGAILTWDEVDETTIYNSVFWSNIVHDGTEAEIQDLSSALDIQYTASMYELAGEGNQQLEMTPFYGVDIDGDDIEELLLNELTGAVNGGSDALANTQVLADERWWEGMTALYSCAEDTDALDLGIHVEVTSCQ